MSNYKNRLCLLCNASYTPNSPKQKYCNSCKDEGRKIADRVRDRKRYRKNKGYEEYTRICLFCSKEFTTYYKKKLHCGSDECERKRLFIKNRRTGLRRDKESERIRKSYYYINTKFDRLLQKAKKYRETNDVDIPYDPRGFGSHDVKFVCDYFNEFGYKLLSDVYENNRQKLLVSCPEGHTWETTFHGFKDADSRCLHCYVNNNYTSKPEQKILNYFMDNYLNIKIRHNDRKLISPFEIDLYFPDNKLGVEVCGLYWHSEVSGGKEHSYHYDKMMRCYEKGVRLITVFEDEINNKFDLVISRIVNALGLINNRIYARKCVLREISTSEANSFFSINHIQGRSASERAWGLFYNNELVSACSIGPVGRKHAGGDNIVELKRFCNKLSFNIVGGFSKLFAQLKKDLSGFIIKSYCDMRYGNIFKPVYEQFGFYLQGQTNYTPHYIKRGKRFRNFSLRKTPEERVLGKTEWELRKAQGYDRIWDCGHRTYVFDNTMYKQE